MILWNVIAEVVQEEEERPEALSLTIVPVDRPQAGGPVDGKATFQAGSARGAIDHLKITGLSTGIGNTKRCAVYGE
jgi:hypothetical protein